MRYLNKIVFINSAHVPYAEIRLDGNVHFIGTQGVGKSTLLRAILFFYNMDKGKLGIRQQDKQKGYDDFYLPYANSYIIYEVCRDDDRFMFVSFRSQGRTTFRIIDCAYDKRYFIDADGMAYSEWGQISQLIGPRFKSPYIRNYEEMRDIIYGNHDNVRKEYRRFSLLESPKYQNIPRTIQNIFLNQSLESRVIKETIIDSMDFANDGIDLNKYREHLKEFRLQYEDIWKWYKREKNGDIKVRKLADEAIDKYYIYDRICKEIDTLCAEINFAYERDSALLPTLAEQVATLTASHSRQCRLLSEESEKYKHEHDSLKEEQGALNSFFKTLDDKRRRYEAINIQSIIEKVRREQQLSLKRDSLMDHINLITGKNSEVKAKFDALSANLDNELRGHELIAQKQSAEIDKDTAAEFSRLNDWQHSQITDIDNIQAEIDEITERINSLKEQTNELKRREQKLQTMVPDDMQQRIDGIAREIIFLKDQQRDLISQQNEIGKQIDAITRDTETACTGLRHQYELDITALKHQKGLKDSALEKLNQLLGRQKGSFIEWLSVNVPGWENTVGKIADEEAVLYNTMLSPEFVNDSDTVFGIHIDTDSISRDIRTPQMIQDEADALSAVISAINAEIEHRARLLDEEIANAKKRPSEKLKTLRRQSLENDSNLKAIPARIDKCNADSKRLDEEVRIWRDRQMEPIRVKLAETAKSIEEAENKQKKLRETKESRKKSIGKEHSLRKKKIERDTKDKKEAVASTLAAATEDIKARKAQLRQQLDEALKGAGVDIDTLNELRRQYDAVEADLKFISDNKRVYTEWGIDCLYYFDLEQQKKEERKKIRAKIESLDQKYERRRHELNEAISALYAEIKAVQEQKKTINGAIERIDNFRLSVSCPSLLCASDVKIETVRQLPELFNDLNSNILDQQRTQENFKNAINDFKSHFSAHNTFHFRTELNTLDDYTEFAVDLHEFVSNNKIEEYRMRTSQRYAQIIQRIAHEVSEISKHGQEINATILDINRDFRENNFAGVIKEIELRAVDSNDRLMQQLMNIKRFDDENSFNLGEQLNLFSDLNASGDINERAVKLLMTLIELMDAERKRDCITLSDTFKLEFKVRENDNDTNWVEKLSNVGSDGTDILVKAMVNIMLINVFKRKVSRRFGDFRLHCMMDEIGKLHPNNVEGILRFANIRNICLINSSPTTYNAQAYRYTYSLSKDRDSNTIVKTLLTIR